MAENLQDKTLNIDITDYWLILRKRALHIILIFILVLIVTIWYTKQQSPVYQSSTKIQIASRQPMATIEGAQITWYGASGNELTSEIKLIANKDELLEKVIGILKARGKREAVTDPHYTAQDVTYLNERLAFSDQSKLYISELRLPRLRASIDIEPVEGSNIVSVAATGPNMEITEAIANTLSIVYRADFIRNKTQDALETRDFIAKRLAEIKKQLETTKGEQEKSSELKAALGSVDVYTEELSKLHVELNRLKERYTDKHPRVIKLKRMMASIEAKLAKLPKAEMKYDDTKASMEVLQSLRKTLGEYYLKAEIDYEAKKQKAKDEIVIISYAQSGSKLRPNEPMNYLAGALFGIILGCLSAFVWEGLDTSIGKIEDVERITKLPVIAHIPLIGQRSQKSTFFQPLRTLWRLSKRAIGYVFPFLIPESGTDFGHNLIFNLNSLSVEAEAYRTLRTNIHFALNTDNPTGHVIAVTSTSPREGKTLTSTNLAIEIAQMGKTSLLIEADMRRPQIASLFKIDQKPGLSDLLLGTDDKSSAIRTITDILMGGSEWEKLMETHGIDNLHILPCGTIPPNPTELLLSHEFRNLIKEAKQEYDFVIVDTPPTLPVSDSSIISTIVDGTVIVYQSDKTSRHLLLRAIQTLQKNRAKLLGIVINQLSFDVILQSTRTKYAYSYTKGEKAR